VTLVQSLTTELTNELQFIRIHDALPALVDFILKQVDDMKQQQSIQQQSALTRNFDEDDFIDDSHHEPSALFPRRQVFMRLLPRRAPGYTCSSYHKDDDCALISARPSSEVGKMAVFTSPRTTHAISSNIYVIDPSSKPLSTSPAPSTMPLFCSPPSQLFCYMACCLPLVTACGHLGSKPSSTDNTLKYCRFVAPSYLRISV
jgi:hypothetical protein